MTNRKILRMILALSLLAALWKAGCSEPKRQPQPSVPEKPQQTTHQQPPADSKTSNVSERLEIPVIADDPNQWLTVEKAREGEKGAWATGTFDPQRNRLSITTKGVQRFVIDTSRVRVDWSKPVVLKIDGAISELKKRDHALIRFDQNDYGLWVVLETDE